MTLSAALMANEYGADGGSLCEHGNRSLGSASGYQRDFSRIAYVYLQGSVIGPYSGTDTKQMNGSFYWPSCCRFCREGIPWRGVLLRPH